MATTNLYALLEKYRSISPSDVIEEAMINFERPSIHRVSKVVVGPNQQCSDFHFLTITFVNATGESTSMNVFGADPIEVEVRESD